MKHLNRIALAAAVVAAAAMAPAFAQEQVGTLQVDGTTMTSDGGEYVRAVDGQPVQAGQRIMVSEGSSATITFTDGTAVTLAGPRVYTVPAGAAGATIGATTSVVGESLPFIAFASVIAASGIAASTLDDDEDLMGEPISR